MYSEQDEALLNSSVSWLLKKFLSLFIVNFQHKAGMTQINAKITVRRNNNLIQKLITILFSSEQRETIHNSIM
jgi:hypothetical protein